MPDVTSGPCTICGEEALPGAAALCNGCGEIFHLVLTQDTEGKDCGEVWLNEEFLALEFGCTRCVAEHRGEAPPVKCNHVSARSMEIFRRLGVAQKLRDAGLPADYPNDVSYRVSFTGEELSRIAIPCRRDRYSAIISWP